MKDWTKPEPRAFGNMSSNEYIEERLNESRSWYEGAATRAKLRYLSMRTASMVFGAVVPILVNVSTVDDKGVTDVNLAEWMKWISTFLSVSVVILISLESIYHFREKWKNYRTTEQLLGKEYFQFTTKGGVYSTLDAEKAFKKLVERVEAALEAESAATLRVMTTVTEGSKDQGNAPVTPPAN